MCNQVNKTTQIYKNHYPKYLGFIQMNILIECFKTLRNRDIFAIRSKIFPFNQIYIKDI